MAGSRKGVRLRLQRAALDLYAERGFDRTTAADVAALAGVTERTYFRHFPDKREVLFDGDAETRTALVDAVSSASAGLSPMSVLLEAFLSVVPMLESDRTVKELRHRVIASTPELQEREHMKWALLTDALAEALERRAVPQGLASLAAACGTAVLTRVRRQWLAGSQRDCGDYATLLTDAFADLGLLVTARDESGRPSPCLASSSHG
ncbi:TetR/AcrR family transcriptional regulator [Streptomyces sp. NPDC096311]|uniref:TetR/AcrR family transcriptional regulator n=1 Tax=Streptomyces sp. NPDC096311 TaxID=3366083 RepID=UPI0037F5D7B0